MCDTLWVPAAATTRQRALFAKNSDRERNEAQALEFVAGRAHAEGSSLVTTYRDIPQTRQTHTVLLSRPFWGWGAEMGANAYGVVVGNEGVHARTPAPQLPALTGMDLVRLALERSVCAEEGAETIISLLEQHGQGGDCGHFKRTYYNNSFLIADADDAFLLETIERDWMLRRLSKTQTVSNAYTIGAHADRHSATLPTLLNTPPFSGFSGDSDPIGNPHREHIGHAGARRRRAAELLDAAPVDLQLVQRVLRDHGGAPGWSPERALPQSICMHAGDTSRHGQTVASLASELNGPSSVHWVTATSAPCLSIFKPIALDAPFPAQGHEINDRNNVETLWWRHEIMHRAVLGPHFRDFLNSIAPERDAIEREFRERMDSVANAEPVTRGQMIAECWRDAEAAEARWLQASRKLPTACESERESSDFRDTWQAFEVLAGLPRGNPQ